MTPHLLLALTLAAGPAGSDTWPGFRGDGSSRTAARDLPLAWAPADGVAWRVATPGYGQSSPVVWKDRVYLTAVEGKEKETLHVLCHALADGKELWRRSFPSTQKGKNNPMMSRAAPTPAADAGGVVAFFESGDLFALTPDGKPRWERHLAKEFGELKNNHGLAASPAQTDRAVLVLVDHQGPSYLLAVDKGDGSTLWKADRPSRTSWTSPVVAPVGGEPVALVSSGGAATAYDAGSGKELWELDGLVGNTQPSATVIGDRLVIGASESVQKPDAAGTARSNCCLTLTAGGPGYEVAWRGAKVSAGTASPLAHAGHVYLVDKLGFVQCLDLATGKEAYRERLPGQVWATPVGAGDRVYVFGKDGVTTVLKAGPEFDVLATNRLWSADDFAARKAAAKKTAGDIPSGPPGGRKGPAGGPPVPKEELDAIRYSAVGDVVYGVAAVDGTFVVRTGTELIAVRGKK